ncbi:hypothetical protein C3L55_08255, partial [Veillonellaceae bacterium M1-70]|nr:hypothetical protein [Veillonellaceae bacterium M1-70]
LTKEGGAVTENKTAIEQNTAALRNLNAPDGTLAKMQAQITANKGKSEANANDIAAITKKGGAIDTAVAKLKNGEVKSNTEAIDAITKQGGKIDTAVAGVENRRSKEQYRGH